MSKLHHALLAAAVIPALAVGCGTTEVKMPVLERQARAFAAPPEKPKLFMVPVDMPDQSWRETSVYWAKLHPDLPKAIETVLTQAVSATNLFSKVENVPWPASERAKHASEGQKGDLLLAVEMPKAYFDGGMTNGGIAVSVCTLGLFNLFSLMGLPTIPYWMDSEWRFNYRLVDLQTGDEVLAWKSPFIGWGQSSFTASWSNTPEYMEKALGELGRTIFSELNTSFAPLATEQRIKVDYPYEVATGNVQIRVKVSDDPALRWVDIDVNDKRLALKDLEKETDQIPVQIDLQKGMNIVNVTALDNRREPVSRLTITITRHK